MTCDEAHPLLHAYVDDELDIATVLQMEKHLMECPKCAKALEGLRALRLAVAQPAAYFPASSALRDRVMQAMRSEAGEVNTSRNTAPLRPWWKRPAVFSGVAAALVIVGSVLFFTTLRSPHAQVAELVDSHVRSLEANHLLDVESTDQHTVKPWFAGRIDFSPPVVDLAAEGFPLIGGRLDYLDQRKVAALIYRRNKHVINVFIWPGAGSPAKDFRQGFNLIGFQCKGMTCWAVSDVNSTELQQFVELFKAQNPISTRN
jgi:anti-sigma factor RsiW